MIASAFNNPAQPAPGDMLARVDDIPDAGAIVRDFQNGEARFSVLLARKDGVVTAYENRCPHAGFPLERPDGRMIVLEGKYLFCAGHGAMFTIESGACVGGPGTGKGLTPLPVDIVDGDVRVSSRAA
ncbi:MAG: Rieske (2Fe-2S) protein [Caulobacterales bacterium]